MQLFTSLCTLAFATTTLALPSVATRQSAKPPAFYLAGDSTTATKGGWGDSFVPLLKNGAIGKNYGHGGATTESFVAGGDWKAVITSVKGAVKTHQPYVTIQFGHNDQKAEKNISVAKFESNLVNLVKEVRSAGGIPILVTSLTRRTFKNGVVVENLVDQVNATLRAAATTKAASIDLNKASTKYINAIGSANADLYNYAAGDRTHLNKPGEIVFANLVGSLISKSVVGKDVASYLNLNKTVVAAVEAGKFILPSV